MSVTAWAAVCRHAWHCLAVTVCTQCSGRSALELPSAHNHSPALSHFNCTQVTVVTCSRPGSGTSSANLFVTVHGSKGPPLTSASTTRPPSTTKRSNASAALTSNMCSSGRCELKGAGSAELSGLVLEPGSRCSFTLPAMHPLGQLRQLLLEVNTSNNQVGVDSGRAEGKVPAAGRHSVPSHPAPGTRGDADQQQCCSLKQVYSVAILTPSSFTFSE